jgi:micrococcal nuclease
VAPKLSWAVALALVLSLLLSCSPDSQIPPPDGAEEVTVIDVIDGDTVQLAPGDVYPQEDRVRYLGINTPERGQPYYEEATEANRRLVEGKTVWIALDAQPIDQYGRILAYVWAGDRFVNLELVRQGYANAYTEPPNVRYSDVLVQAEREAREAGLGIWQRADVPIRIDELHYDAPGADHENPNGEWVTIANSGREPQTLEGFSLRDEARHVYTFPPLILLPGQTITVYSGQGRDDDTHLYWGLSGDAVWNNDGDTAYLRDPQGLLVDVHSY